MSQRRRNPLASIRNSMRSEYQRCALNVIRKRTEARSPSLPFVGLRAAKSHVSATLKCQWVQPGTYTSIRECATMSRVRAGKKKGSAQSNRRRGTLLRLLKSSSLVRKCYSQTPFRNQPCQGFPRGHWSPHDLDPKAPGCLGRS